VIEGSRSRELRRSVLRPHFDPTELLPGDERADVVHFGASAADGELLSTCLIFPQPCPWHPDEATAWQLRSMATAPAARGRGLAALVLAAAIDYIAGHGGGLLWCNARDVAVPLYERAGFAGDGDRFVEHDIPHLGMSRPVAAVDRFNAVVGAGTLRSDSTSAVIFPHRWTDAGVTVDTTFSGAHLLHLAAAGCVLNDLYREAVALAIELRGARVTGTGGFDPTTWASTGIAYTVELDTDASAADVGRLLDVVDSVAEIPRAIRSGAVVSRVTSPR
jgi:predicted GNAT family N-acyltransferase